MKIKFTKEVQIAGQRYIPDQMAIVSDQDGQKLVEIDVAVALQDDAPGGFVVLD